MRRRPPNQSITAQRAWLTDGDRSKMSSVIHRKDNASPESFQQALHKFLAVGYHVLAPVTKNRDGIAVQLKKDEAVWLEWFEGDSLVVSVVSDAREQLKEEVSRLLDGTKLGEIRVL